MAAGTSLQQSQKVIEEQLAVILQVLKQRDVTARQRHVRLHVEVTAINENLQEQSDKLEGQKACYEELRQQMKNLVITQTKEHHQWAH